MHDKASMDCVPEISSISIFKTGCSCPRKAHPTIGRMMVWPCIPCRINLRAVRRCPAFLWLRWWCTGREATSDPDSEAFRTWETFLCKRLSGPLWWSQWREDALSDLRLLFAVVTMHYGFWICFWQKRFRGPFISSSLIFFKLWKLATLTTTLRSWKGKYVILFFCWFTSLSHLNFSCLRKWTLILVIYPFLLFILRIRFNYMHIMRLFFFCLLFEKWS